MKVVLDTNIWLSGIFWEGEAYRLINKLEKNKVEIIISKKIILEIIEVLNREDKFQKFIEDKNLAIKDIIRTILNISRLIVSKNKLYIIKEHLSDNKILESAIDGKANYIISYDNHLLRLKEFKKIKILTPREFLKMT